MARAANLMRISGHVVYRSANARPASACSDCKTAKQEVQRPFSSSHLIAWARKQQHDGQRSHDFSTHRAHGTASAWLKQNRLTSKPCRLMLTPLPVVLTPRKAETEGRQ